MDGHADSSWSEATGTALIEPPDAPAAGAAEPAGWRSWLPDALPLAMLIALVPVAHNVPAMLRLPYWLDESWVALPRRLPLGDVLDLMSSTPLGYALLVRLVPDPDALRLVTLLFLVGTVVAGYGLGRILGWRSRTQAIIAGSATGLAVLLLPAQQARHDLKQYTADAAAALLLLVMVAWIERGWSRRRLAALVCVIAVGMLFSHTTAIVAVCACVGLCLVPLVRRQWDRLVEALATGATGGVVVAAIYVGISKRGQTDSLEDYWSNYYPSLGDLPTYVLRRLRGLELYLGLPWQLFVLLACVGVLALVRMGRPALAISAGLLPVALVGLGVARLYPLLDLRTSHFLLVVGAALAGLGGCWLAIVAGRVLGQVLAGRFALNARYVELAVTLMIITAAFGAVTVANAAWLRFDGDEPDLGLRIPMAADDVRASTRYIQEHRAAGDIVIVNTLGAYGFAYYWTADPPGFERAPDTALGWVTSYPRSSGIVVVDHRRVASIDEALTEARQLAAERGPGTRIWVLQSHVNAAERRLWEAALKPGQAGGAFGVETVRVGVETVLILTPRQ